MYLCILLTPVGIDKVRSETDFQLWACDPLALASGQVQYIINKIMKNWVPKHWY
jgi:hypothetical protein